MGAYYHIYNRGVAKQNIFLCHRDYLFFIRKVKQFKENRVEIISYCLMPNHFHLLVRNETDRGIEYYMKSMGISYTLYFNKKYDRVGSLFQGTYKARLIKTETDFLNTIEYIRKNPIELGVEPQKLSNYPYSGLEKQQRKWGLTRQNPAKILTSHTKHVN
jgi:putative transposase